jgi:hypothetical protein
MDRWQRIDADRNNSAFRAGSLVLLTNGDLLCNDRAHPRSWVRLRPDPVRGYQGASHAHIAHMNAERRHFPTAVLLDGRLLVVGGVDRDGNPVAGAEIYEPTHDTWTPIDAPRIGRGTAALLEDGRVIVGFQGSGETAIFHPASATFVAGPPHEARPGNWTSFIDAHVLAFGAEGRGFGFDEFDGQRWTPWTIEQAGGGPGTPDGEFSSSTPALWIPPDGDGSILHAGGIGFDRGGGLRMFVTGEGTVSIDEAKFSDQHGEAPEVTDLPIAFLPDGRFLIIGRGRDGVLAAWTVLADLEEVYGDRPIPLVRMELPTGTGEGRDGAWLQLLPGGEAILAAGASDLAILTPTNPSVPQLDWWRPHVTMAPSALHQGATVMLTGHQLNGITSGVNAPAGGVMSHLPIVTLHDPRTGHWHYCRGVSRSSATLYPAVPGLFETPHEMGVYFDVPEGLEVGAYDLVVWANGIPSGPISVPYRPVAGQGPRVAVDRFKLTGVIGNLADGIAYRLGPNGFVPLPHPDPLVATRAALAERRIAYELRVLEALTSGETKVVPREKPKPVKPRK